MEDKKLTKEEENYYEKAYNEIMRYDGLININNVECNSVIYDIIFMYIKKNYKWSTYQQLYEYIRDIDFSELFETANKAFEEYRYFLLASKVTALNDIASYLESLTDDTDKALEDVNKELERIAVAVRYLQ